jgi:hypothetical protein
MIVNSDFMRVMLAMNLYDRREANHNTKSRFNLTRLSWNQQLIGILLAFLPTRHQSRKQLYYFKASVTSIGACIIWASVVT